MTVNDIINYLKTGEIRQLAVKDDVPALLPLINLGLLEIHKIFDIRYDEIIIDTNDGDSLYSLPSNLIRISNVYDENGIELPLNKEDEEYSVYTPSTATLQIPQHADDYSVSVIYVASHPEVKDTSATVELSPVYLDALLLCIAYKAHSGYSSGPESQTALLFGKYQFALKLIKDSGSYALDEVPTPDKITTGGWV